MGTGLGHYVPLVVYLGSWVMCLVSLTGRPLYGLYYLMPLLPYRSLRDHYADYPLGGNMLTILVVAVILGALFHGKRLPKSKLYMIWLVFAIYLYFSMWIGTMLGTEPPPLWMSDINFVTWKDYLIIPLVFVAAGLVVQDRKAVKTVIFITALSLLLIDKSALASSLAHNFSHFDESKRDGGPLQFAGSNGLGAFLAQFAIFFWGFGQYLKRIKLKLICYTLVSITLLATMYTFSRGSYLAVLASVFVLAVLKDRKLLVVVAVFLLMWESVVPTAVRERVNMTETSTGKLEASAQERVDLWENAKETIISSPVFGTGYASFQLGSHVDNLKDTHNWYVKVMVETGVIGAVFVLMLLQQMIALAYRLFRAAKDPLYQGLGLGLLLAVISCLVSNMFGERWTYIEINGLLWVLCGVAARALELTQQETVPETTEDELATAMPPYMAYR